MTDEVPHDSVDDALRLRASDADREKVAAVLRDAFVEGRLTAEEHESRLTQVYAAQTYADLVPALHDLPVPPGTIAVPAGGGIVSVTGPGVPTTGLSAGPPSPALNSGGVVVDPSREGQAVGHAIAVMSGVERKGRWVVPAQSNAIAVMGGIEYNFCDAVLTAHETVITVFALMGGVEVVVPAGIDVRIEVVGFMGGSEGPRDTAPPGSPVLVFTGLAVMGGLEVKRPKAGRTTT